MTGSRRSHSSTGLWTGIITLLLFSSSVHTESSTSLNENVPSQLPLATERPSGSVSTLHKTEPIVNVPSTTLKTIDERPEALLEAVTSGEKVVGNSTSNSKGSQPQLNPENVSAKPSDPNTHSRIIKVEENRRGDSLPEFNEKEDYSDVHELDEDNKREPTTQRANKEPLDEKWPFEEGKKKMGSSSTSNTDEYDIKETEKKHPNIGISLANDTNVNYNNKKTVKVSKDDETNFMTSPENSTNLIASGGEADTQLNKGKGPKAQVEVVKNSTLPKHLRISELNNSEEIKNVESLDSIQQEIATKSGKTTVIPVAKDPTDANNKKISKDAQLSSEKTINDTRTLSSPKARTISFGGTNEFLTTENKTIEVTDRPNVIEITEESVYDDKSSNFKPYPYAKTTSSYQTNGSDSQLPQSTEEVSALENTIGQRQQDKKFVVTEPSVVIDNSIQQFKPTYYKRSGNASRIPSSIDLTISSTTIRSIDETEKSQTTPSSVISENSTTVFVGSSRVSNTENDVPRDKAHTKDTSSSLDLTGNGITEVVGGTKNESVQEIEEPVTKASIALSTHDPSTTRATEDTKVQNVTEKMVTANDELAMTNVDIQTDAGDSMLKLSSLNVTEDSTRVPSTENPTSIPTLTTMLSSLATTSPKSTSSISFDMDQMTTMKPERSTNGLHQETRQAEESSTPIELIDSTTSNVEYEFVGLTETTVSQSYLASSEKPNVVGENKETASTTQSGFSTTSSPTSAMTLIIRNSSIEVESTTEKDTMDQKTSTLPLTSTMENQTSEESTTSMSNLDFTGQNESTEDSPDTTTMIDDVATTDTNAPLDSTTDDASGVTNFTSAPEILPDATKNMTDSGRAVDSSTSIPDSSDTKSNRLFDSSTIVTTDVANILIITTDSPAVSNTPKILIENTTPDEGIIEPTTTAKPEVPSTTIQDSVDIVTDISNEINGRTVPSLVRVIFEGSWADVCPHLSSLRQSLADLLTAGLEKPVLASQIVFQKNPCTDGFLSSTATTELSVTTLLLYVVDQDGNFDSDMTQMLPNLYSKSPIKLQVTIHSFQLVQDSDSGNAIAVVVVSCVAFICLVLLAGLLFIMRKRQTRFNYGERCRPVSLDAFSLDSVSAYNSVRRKGAARASKRSYGNPTFEDSSAIPSHPLNFSGLSTFCNEQNSIAEEFAGIPQVTARIDELPPGAEVKNRYANVVPLPETRVSLMKINNDPLTEYINASYVRGPKNATKYYIACQAPIESTVTDFWRMIWEQQTKVIIMLTDLVENGVEKCAEYIPPSEVTDCHRLFGDFQATLKKRETKEKYAISTLHLKNLENNTFREISHIWYLWPANGVQSDAAGLIAVLLEARALQRGGPGPVVVHCSPGTGRTGTLIALDLGIRQYEITRTVDVPRVVYTIRRDRAGAVQTKEQYAFIYKALNLYATKLAGGVMDSS